MSAIPLHAAAYHRDLGDQLILRWATADDTDGLVQLYSHVFRDRIDEPPNPRAASWTRIMMSGRHPLVAPTDFAVVEDTSQRKIVAAANLMTQTWEYAGVSLGMGRPEIVASDPQYRNRGLIRAIFELLHARSAARGHLVQGITGIFYYYRQFGYEYALDLGGGYTIYFATIPPLRAGNSEPFRLREATLEDAPLLAALYDQERAGLLVSTRIAVDYWQFLLAGGLPDASAKGWRTQMIVDLDQQVLGYVLTSHRPRDGELIIRSLAVQPGVSLKAVLPSVLRMLQALTFPPDPHARPPYALRFNLGREHPVYHALGPALADKYHPPYAWYVRVPDLPALIRQIAPALEHRLTESVLVGYTGELKLDFYRGGLRLEFAGGRLQAVEHWRAERWHSQPDGGCQPLVFLQLLFGYRSLAELRHAFPDVWASSDGTILLETLFPPQLSFVMALD